MAIAGRALSKLEQAQQNIKVLDKGFVRLDGFMIDVQSMRDAIYDDDSSNGYTIPEENIDRITNMDLSVVNSARVSFNRRHSEFIDEEKSEWLKKNSRMDIANERDDRLINYLMKNRHGTPFEHNAFRFHVKAPIFVFREWQRHRISSFNEWSARYSKLEPEFYIPEIKNIRKRVGKPGNYRYEPMEESEAIRFRTKLQQSCTEAYINYDQALNDDVAPELARGFLNVFTYSQMYYTTNARSLMNFLSLRTAETAQFEIQEFARAIEVFFKLLMPETAKAFEANGRVSP